MTGKPLSSTATSGASSAAIRRSVGPSGAARVVWPSALSDSVRSAAASALSSTTTIRSPTAAGVTAAGAGSPLVGGGGETEGEVAAAPAALAVSGDGAAVHGDQAAHDGQAEAEAALRAIERLPLLHEQVEDPRQHLRFDPDAVVAHPEDHLCAAAPGLDRDVPL